MKLSKYSFGTGDRFGQAGQAQLRAVQQAVAEGMEITPVWNKSYREHKTIGSAPKDTRIKADESVEQLGWGKDYFVDADHITMETVDQFLSHSDFFTIDVADQIGKAAREELRSGFVQQNEDLVGEISVPGLSAPVKITPEIMEQSVASFLNAVDEAQKVYEHIVKNKNRSEIVIEISMDEVESPQTPEELLIILKMLSDAGVNPNTIAPKFSGRFNKGVDYEGDLSKFSREFEQDVLIIEFAKAEFGLPDDLKLSIHSGSDKFSIYEPMRRIVKKHKAGLHVKTAGTTWLEELTGLAEAGGEGLDLARKIYGEALERYEELTAPYETVLSIDRNQLPELSDVKTWSGERFVRALSHNQSDELYNPNFRQLLHCAYKIPAEMGKTFMDALNKHKDYISPRVTENLLQRHIKPLFAD